jgi:hypothetical protein
MSTTLRRESRRVYRGFMQVKDTISRHYSEEGKHTLVHGIQIKLGKI